MRDDFVYDIKSHFFEDIEVLNAYYNGETTSTSSTFKVKSELLLDGSVLFAVENFDYLVMDFT